MIKLIIFSFFVLGCTSTSASMAQDTTVPQVNLFISPLFDGFCEKEAKYTINPAWKTELAQIFPDLVMNWNDKGTQLLKATQEVAGAPFNRKEFDATLSLCSFPSMSHPLLINMRYSLKSFTASPLPMHATISVIHHEILHHYLLGKVPKDSTLFKKYASEDPRVKVHLHLLALQKAVYVHLNWNKELEDVISKDEALPPGLYKRAWEIVRIEGHQAFVDEIKSKEP